MSLTLLFAAGPGTLEEYRAPLRAALRDEGLDAKLSDSAAPESVDYIIYAPASPLQDFTPFTRAKAVLSLWAGVERIVSNPTLTQPLARMVDPALTQGMVDYVCGHVLRYHLGMDAHITARPGAWDDAVPPLASERNVTVLGLGALGQACARALAGLGFAVTGWSSSPKDMDAITCVHGADGLKAALQAAEILVTLLPDTSQTENLLNAQTLALLPKGARVLNPGRGTLIDDAALLEALDSGQIGHATLDVFRSEPLPESHPYWHHPGVTVTPHIAAATRADSASRVLARNIARVEAGEPLLHEVPRARGY